VQTFQNVYNFLLEVVKEDKSLVPIETMTKWMQDACTKYFEKQLQGNKRMEDILNELFIKDPKYSRDILFNTINKLQWEQSILVPYDGILSAEYMKVQLSVLEEKVRRAENRCKELKQMEDQNERDKQEARKLRDLEINGHKANYKGLQTKMKEIEDDKAELEKKIKENEGYKVMFLGLQTKMKEIADDKAELEKKNERK